MDARHLMLFTSVDDAPRAARPVPLRRVGRHFRGPDDQIYKGLHIDEFRGPQLMLDNRLDDLNTYDAFETELTVSGVRAFSYNMNMRADDFDPRKYRDALGLGPYYQGIENYLDHRLNRGKRVHLVAHLGAYGPPEYNDPFLDYDSQAEHLEREVAICRKFPLGSIFLEIWNEADDTRGTPRVYEFPASMFAGVLTCRSRVTDVFAQGKFQLDFFTLHSKRAGPEEQVAKMRELHEIERILDLPGMNGEPPKTGEELTPAQSRVAAALCLAGGEIYDIHGSDQDLQFCKVPSGATLDGCRQASEIYKLGIVPAEASGWLHSRDENVGGEVALEFRLGGPGVAPKTYGCKHLYCWTSPDDRTQIAIPVDPSDASEADPKDPSLTFKHITKPGWRIVRDDIAAVLLERA